MVDDGVGSSAGAVGAVISVDDSVALPIVQVSSNEPCFPCDVRFVGEVGKGGLAILWRGELAV
jgi:hypothetical protein